MKEAPKSKMHTANVRVGEGKFALEAVVTVTPRGIIVYACSPEYAHLGATAQAIPRPEPGRTATVSILSVPCHRDEIPAHDICAALATEFKMPCTCSTGFHVEHANKDDLQTVLDTTAELIDALKRHVARVLRATWDEADEVLAVHEDGSVIGPVDRIEAHAGEGILHQAFETFLVEGTGDGAHLLLCRRSALKRLWGGVLSDSCAGHPEVGEELAVGASRRLQEECGLTPDQAPLKQLGHIVYREDHGDGNCECEWCAVFAARIDVGSLCVNEQEISEVRPVRLNEIDAYLAGHPEPLAPWTRLALEDADIRAKLAELCQE